jgi:nickel-dependent lactate racemase
VVDRIWLDVTYVEKDLGEVEDARGDPSAEYWYAATRALAEAQADLKAMGVVVAAAQVPDGGV